MERFSDNNVTNLVFMVQLKRQCACESGFSLESFLLHKVINRLNAVKCISFTPALNSCGLPFPFDSGQIFVIDTMFFISFFFNFVSNFSLP